MPKLAAHLGGAANGGEVIPQITCLAVELTELGRLGCGVGLSPAHRSPCRYPPAVHTCSNASARPLLPFPAVLCVVPRSSLFDTRVWAHGSHV